LRGLLQQLERLSLERLSWKPSRVAIKTNGKILFIDPAEVSAVEAQGNYVLLRRGPDSYVLRGSISELAEKLEPCGFIRIHRSVLVNTSFVQELQPWATGEYILRMRDGKEYSVSRSYKGNLRSIAQFWVGSEGSAEELDSVLR
jgi:two-component system LytT family response regulator